MKNNTLVSLTASAVMALGLATAASAVPIGVTFYSGTQLTAANSQFYTDYNALVAGFGTSIVEDFENHSGFTGNFENGAAISLGGDGEIATSIGTSVGSFTTLGGTGNGSTCASLSFNGPTCDNIALQQAPSINGQGNITPFGGQWALNTADTTGLAWSVNTGSLFSELLFVLRDPGDQGNKSLTIAAGGEIFTDNNLPNEELLLVRVMFGSQLSDATINITTSRNDAFTFDGAAVNVVPLPAAAWMLLAGLGGLAVIRRRQKS